ncbi:MAG TPA: M28 family peptidase [Gemmatimonadaceae bacterium]
MPANTASRLSRAARPLAAALLASCASAAPHPSSNASSELPRTLAPRPTEGAITPADLMTRLYIFADDSMLGREAGTLGNVRATNYVAREMRRMGLQPGGENGTYFQTVPVAITRIDTTQTLAVDGTPLALGTDVLPFYGPGGARALPVGATTRSLNGVRVVYGGQLGGELIQPRDAAGKVVVFTVPAGANGRRDWRFYLHGPLTQYGDAAGIAAATLDVVPAANLRRLRSPNTHPVNTALTGSAPAILLITPSAAAHLLGVSTLDNLSVGTSGRTLSGDLRFVDTPAPYPSRNVIGILPGSDPALRGEYVAVGAHNDHIGLERHPLDHDSVLANNMVVRRQGVQDTVVVPTPEQAARIAHLRDSLRVAHGGVRPDSVNNGADDDGSGTVAMLEIAERFATDPARPRRSLLFVSHTGEEKGLWGSQWFTDHPTVPRDSIVAQLNMDMVGRGKPTDIMGRGPNNVQMIGSRRLSTQLGDLIDSVNAARTPHMDIDPSFDTNGHPLNRYCRSDHYMYARYGIPITYFSLGYHTDYHQVTDEPQYIDYEHMARIAGFVHDIALAVANRPQRLVVDKPIPDLNAGCRQ